MFLLVDCCYIYLFHVVGILFSQCITLVQQQNAQDLNYITVDHSKPRPIFVPNENLDVQYTGVKFESEGSTE